MRILDQNGNEVENPNLELGYLKSETITIHHDAINPVSEISHMEVIWPKGVDLSYQGSKLLKKVIDSPYIPGKKAYDTEERIQRYILYTETELEEIAQKKAEQEAQEKAEELAREEEKKQSQKEAEEKAAKEQIVEEFVSIGPAAIAELSVLSSEQSMQIEIMQQAIAELAVMSSGQEE